MKKRNREELAWCAGFFDGEGNVCFSASGLRSQIGQVNREALDRFSSAVGFGSVTGPYAPSKGSVGTRRKYFLSFNTFEEVQAIVAMLWQWLGSVKRRQAASALRQWRRRRKKNRRGASKP